MTLARGRGFSSVSDYLLSLQTLLQGEQAGAEVKEEAEEQEELGEVEVKEEAEEQEELGEVEVEVKEEAEENEEDKHEKQE